jgi:hypothetical protein
VLSGPCTTPGKPAHGAPQPRTTKLADHIQARITVVLSVVMQQLATGHAETLMAGLAMTGANDRSMNGGTEFIGPQIGGA